MNRKEFYNLYRQARFLVSARSLYAIKANVDAPEGNLIWRAIDGLHESVAYALHNKYKATYYPITTHKWAIRQNSKF